MKKLENFISAFAATRLLLNKAYDNGSLIEGLVLYSSLVEAQCRICLVLEQQLEEKTNRITEKYIFQEGNDYLSERIIYQLAYEKKIITRSIYDELNKLYDVRNKAIHRFFTSEIEYSHLGLACSRYEKIFQELNKINKSLEDKQVATGYGMTKSRIDNGIEVKVEYLASKKINSRSERSFAKTYGVVSNEEVVEFGRKKGLFAICDCGHAKAAHFVMKGKNILFVECLTDGCNCKKFKKR